MGWLQDFIHADDGSDSDADQKQEPVKPQKQVLLFEPKEFNDISVAADQLIAGRVVVINLNRMVQEEKQRVVDFINGVVYSQKGKITKGGFDLIVCAADPSMIAGESFAPDAPVQDGISAEKAHS